MDKADMIELARWCQPKHLEPALHWTAFDWSDPATDCIGQTLRCWDEDAGVWERARVMNYCPKTKLHYVLQCDWRKSWATVLTSSFR